MGEGGLEKLGKERESCYELYALFTIPLHLFNFSALTGTRNSKDQDIHLHQTVSIFKDSSTSFFILY